MANQTPDDGYIKDLLARLRANIDSDVAEEAEKEAELERESAPTPVDVYDTIDEDDDLQEDEDFDENEPPFSLDDDEPYPEEDEDEDEPYVDDSDEEDEAPFAQEDTFEDKEEAEELPAYAQADPFISLEEEDEENISFRPEVQQTEEEETEEEEPAPVIDVFGEASDEEELVFDEAEEVEEDEEAEDEPLFDEDFEDEIEEDETEPEQEEEIQEEDEPYFVEPIVNKPLFEETPAFVAQEENVETEEEIESESVAMPEEAEADVAFGLAVTPVRETERAAEHEAPASAPAHKQPLLPTLKGLVRMRESYDNVFEKGLAENELCPHTGKDTMAESNVTLTTTRALTVRRRRAILATVAMGVLGFFTLLYETIPAFAYAVLSAFGLLETKGMAHAFDFAALLVALLIFIPKIKHSILALREKVLSPDFVVFVCASVSALFLLVRIFAGSGILLFAALPAVFALFVAQLCHMLSLFASITNAEICLESEGGATTVIRSPSDLPDVSAALAQKAAQKRQIMSVARFSNHTAFLKKLGSSYLSPRFSLLSLIVAGSLAVLSALFYGFATGFAFVADVFCLFCVVLCASVSLALFMLHSYAYRRLCRTL
ncbi:MAG: hypothetical protein J6V82_00325, partial [Clostridia bacterium]|nr:hypothetical protein [Clostridia bacterium]